MPEFFEQAVRSFRLFRVDRMREARLLEGPEASFTVPPDFDIRAWLGRPPWERGTGPVMCARVSFRFPTSRWIQNQRNGRLTRHAGEDGAAEFEFDVRDRPAFLRWLLSFRRDATLLEPADLADELSALRRQVAALYADQRLSRAHGRASGSGDGHPYRLAGGGADPPCRRTPKFPQR